MRWLLFITLCFLMSVPALAQAPTPTAMAQQIDDLLREYEALGSKPFETRWPNGSVKEKYAKDEDGTWSYAKFFPTGGYAVKYQKRPSKAIYYERWFGNGKTAVILNRDERITDYTGYWESGDKKAKYQHNKHTKETFYEARDKNGKQVYPPVR